MSALNVGTLVVKLAADDAALRKGIESAGRELKKANDNWKKQLGDFGGTFGEIGERIGRVGLAAKKTFGDDAPRALQVYGQQLAAIGGLTESQTKALRQWGEAGEGAFKLVGNAATLLLTPIGMIAAGVAAVGVGIWYLPDALKATGAALTDTESKTSQWTVAVATLNQEVGELYTRMRAAATDVFDSWLQAVQPISDTVVGIAGAIYDSLSEAFRSVVTFATDAFSRLYQSVASGIAPVVDTITAAFEVAFSWIRETFAGIWDSFRSLPGVRSLVAPSTGPSASTRARAEVSSVGALATSAGTAASAARETFSKQIADFWQTAKTQLLVPGVKESDLDATAKKDAMARAKMIELENDLTAKAAEARWQNFLREAEAEDRVLKAEQDLHDKIVDQNKKIQESYTDAMESLVAQSRSDMASGKFFRENEIVTDAEGMSSVQAKTGWAAAGAGIGNMVGQAAVGQSQYLGAALQGASAGSSAGPWGALIGALVGLLTKSKQFAAIISEIDDVLGPIVDILGSLLSPLKDLLHGLGELLRELATSFQTAFDWLWESLASIFDGWAAETAASIRSWKSSVEDSGDAAADALDALGETATLVNAAFTNIPEGYKLSQARFAALLEEGTGPLAATPTKKTETGTALGKAPEGTDLTDQQWALWMGVGPGGNQGVAGNFTDYQQIDGKWLRKDSVFRDRSTPYQQPNSQQATELRENLNPTPSGKTQEEIAREIYGPRAADPTGGYYGVLSSPTTPQPTPTTQSGGSRLVDRISGGRGIVAGAPSESRVTIVVNGATDPRTTAVVVREEIDRWDARQRGNRTVGNPYVGGGK